MGPSQLIQAQYKPISQANEYSTAQHMRWEKVGTD